MIFFSAMSHIFHTGGKKKVLQAVLFGAQTFVGCDNVANPLHASEIKLSLVLVLLGMTT